MNKMIRKLLVWTAVCVALSFTVSFARDWTDGSFTLWNSFGSEGTGDGQFQQADGIAVDEDGLIYVSDYQLHRIQVFQADGTFVRKWGSQGSGEGQFQNPRGLDIGPDGNLYVCDWGNHRICVFQPDGTFVRSWGSYGTGDGQFNNPYRISINDSGQVFVSDYNNKRVQVFELKGVFLRQFQIVSASGDSEEPSAIVAKGGGEVFVGQKTGQYTYVVKYDSNGDRGISWGTSYHYYTAKFGGIDIDSKGTIYSSTIYHMAPAYKYYPNIQLRDNSGSLLKELKDSLVCHSANFALAPDLSIVKIFDYYTIDVCRWLDRTAGDSSYKFGCWVEMASIQQRAGYPYLDIDFRVNSDDDATNAHVAMCAFLNGDINLSNLVSMRTFVGGTETNLGENIELSPDMKRVTWNMAADWSADSGDLQVQAFVQEGPYYLPFNFLTIPPQDPSDYIVVTNYVASTNEFITGTNGVVAVQVPVVEAFGISNAFQICRTPVTHDDLIPVWMYLVASGDSSVQLVNGKVYGTQGIYEGQVFVQKVQNGNTGYPNYTPVYKEETSNIGKKFLWDRMSLRDPTAEELTWAKEATIPGVQKWDARFKVGGRPSKVNEFGLDTGATSGFWAVKK